MSYVQTLSSSGFREQRIPGFCPSFQLLGSKKQFGVGDRIFTINLMGQHSPILGTKAFVEVILYHLLHMILLDSGWGTLSGVSVPVEIGTLQTQPHSLPFPAWENKTPYLRHQRSSWHHSVCPTSRGHCLRWASLPKLLTRSPRNPCKDLEDTGQQVTVIPTGVVKHGQVLLPWVVGHCILVLFILKGGQINFYPKTSSSLPQLATFPRNPHLAWMPWTLFTLSNPNCFLLKRVSLPKVPWEAVGFSATYISFDFSFSTGSGPSINQVHGSYHHFVSASHQSLPLSLASTP